MSVDRELRTLIAVASGGSFAAAARRLGLSPAMVGRRIQALEDRYGVKLIERTTRTLRLTDIGQDVLERARDVVEAVDDIAEIARPEPTEPTGRVRISAPVTFGARTLSGIAARLTATHPELTVELRLDDGHADLVRDGFDLAVRIGELTTGGLISRRIGTYPFVCCAAPSYLARVGVPSGPDALVAADCVLNLNLVPRDRWPFRREGEERRLVEARGRIEIDSDEAQRMAALAGAGIVYAPRDLVEEDLASGALVAVLSGWETMTLPISILHPSRRNMPRRVRVTIDAIAAHLAR